MLWCLRWTAHSWAICWRNLLSSWWFFLQLLCSYSLVCRSQFVSLSFLSLFLSCTLERMQDTPRKLWKLIRKLAEFQGKNTFIQDRFLGKWSWRRPWAGIKFFLFLKYNINLLQNKPDTEWLLPLSIICLESHFLHLSIGLINNFMLIILIQYRKLKRFFKFPRFNNVVLKQFWIEIFKNWMISDCNCIN